MDNVLPSNEYVEVEGRTYINPQVGVDETTSFIDKLRATQGQQNQEITQQTQRLGTDIPTNLGGLTGAEGYFTSRYQTPQTASNIANLRATNQAKALKDALANEYSIWKNRYTQAYRNYRRRSSGSSGSGGSGGYTTSTTGDTTIAGQGAVETIPTDTEATVTYEGSVTAQPGQKVVIGPDGIVQGYIDGEYVELRPGQAYTTRSSLAPVNSIGPQSSLAPTNTLQRR